MTKNKLWKRYLVFFIGLFINSFGVAVITKGNLGTSPISSIPYVMSLGFPLTLGEFTILLSLLLILLQILILGKKFEKISLLQIPMSIVFGYFIDFSMILLQWLSPENYIFRLAALIAGCVILGFGVYTEVIADVVMLPGEAFVKAVTVRWNTEFGITKVCFDASMTILAAILSFIMFSRLNGVGIGTIIAALIVGIIARSFGKILLPLTHKLFGESEVLGSTGEMSFQGHRVITIGREFGSGGRAIGKLIAKKLDISYYDSELLNLFAKETGKDEKYFEQADQKLTNSFLFDLYLQSNAYTSEDEKDMHTLFESEKTAIEKIAQNEDCVIVGRLANFMLPHDKNILHVFLNGELEDKISHVQTRDNLTYKDAKNRIQKAERERREFCRLMTGKEWGHSKYYDLCINTSGCGVEKACDGILWFLENRGLQEHKVRSNP